MDETPLQQISRLEQESILALYDEGKREEAIKASRKLLKDNGYTAEALPETPLGHILKLADLDEDEDDAATG